MRLELGAGGAVPPDVAVERAAPETLSLRTGNSERMRVTPAGRVGIGTSSPSDTLDVAGNVRAVSFIAGNTTLNVPDYVFSENYSLMPLEALRAYIARERHLPGMPGAREVAKEGLDLGRFQMKLLEKIEELTLRILEQDEALRAQRLRVERLAAELGALRRAGDAPGSSDSPGGR